MRLLPYLLFLSFACWTGCTGYLVAGDLPEADGGSSLSFGDNWSPADGGPLSGDTTAHPPANDSGKPPAKKDSGKPPAKKDSGAPPAKKDSGKPPAKDSGPPPAGRWKPKPGTTWQWQLEGNINTSLNVKMYDIDLFDNSASVIAKLKSQGRKVVCYFSAGSYESWRPDAKAIPTNALGSKMDGWDERWLDIRSAGVRAVMSKRLDLAKSKGCDGVEPDNVDGYANSNGLGLTASHQLSYNKFLAAEAHKRGLSVGLKNDLDQVKQLEPYFDWALNEECMSYSECGVLNAFIKAGKAVFHVEYKPASKSSVCPKAKQYKFDTLIKKLSLDAWRDAC